ncbi:unnamed protein product, partial [Brassica oleracea var. botrytis]
CNVSISYIVYLLIIYFSLYYKFTYYLLFSIFVNNNATCHILEEFFSLMWMLYGASKGSFY